MAVSNYNDLSYGSGCRSCCGSIPASIALGLASQHNAYKDLFILDETITYHLHITPVKIEASVHEVGRASRDQIRATTKARKLTGTFA